MLKCGFQNIRGNFMDIKDNCQIVLEIAQGIKSAARELQLSSVSCQAGTTQVDMECSQSYENGKTTLADYHIFMEELGENIKEIGVDLEDADKNLLQK